MDSTASTTTAIIPLELGAAAEFNPEIFPRAYYDAGDNYNKGVVLIRATLNEMRVIGQLGIDLKENAEFIVGTRAELDESVSDIHQ